MDRGRRHAERGARPSHRRARRASGRPTGSPATSTGWAGEPARGAAGARTVRSCSTAAWARCSRTAASRTACPASSGTSRTPTRSARRTRPTPTAGARLLTTNTFGGTRPRLDMHGLGDRVGEVNRDGGADRPIGGRRARTARRRRPRPDRRAAGAARDPDPRGRPGAVRRAAHRRWSRAGSTWCWSRR